LLRLSSNDCDNQRRQQRQALLSSCDILRLRRKAHIVLQRVNNQQGWRQLAKHLDYTNY